MPKSSAVPECRHILTSGRKCRGIALKGRPFCHQHARQRNYTARNQRSLNSVELPPLEDHVAIRIAIDQVVFALTHGRITDKLAGRLLYAIQLAQNSINRTEEVAPEEMVTDHIDGHYGDIAAPAEPNVEFSEEPSCERAAADDFAPLSAHAKTHSGHGDTCWEPTNADYPDHPTDNHPANEPSAEPNAVPSDPPTPGLTAKISPAGTRDNSPGRESRDRETNLNSEVPEGRPKLASVAAHPTHIQRNSA